MQSRNVQHLSLNRITEPEVSLESPTDWLRIVLAGRGGHRHYAWRLTAKLTTNGLDLYGFEWTSLDAIPALTCGDGLHGTSLDNSASIRSPPLSPLSYGRQLRFCGSC
jgi:hypothetical protein